SSRVCRASRPSPAPPPPCTRSGTRAPRQRSRSRSGSAIRRAALSIVGAEAVGPYTLLRVRRGGLDPGRPGQFFMLEAPGRLLPPHAEVAVEPTSATEAMPLDRDVLACGPEPMLEAVRQLVPDAQLAWEAPMACGYGACYGCAVEIDGELRRLCVDGPVLQGGSTSAGPRPKEATVSRREPVA